MSTSETVPGAASATPDGAEPRVRRPVILAVDDEPAVLAAVARDLRRGFGERYRIMRAGSGAEALDLLEQIRSARRAGRAAGGRPADAGDGRHRLPGPGPALVPEAKRVLLTAYADTEAAIAAINEVALDYYLLKPWDPPEEQLLPGRRGPADDLGGGRGAGVRRRARDRPPLLQGVARPARLPRAQPCARRAGSTSSATARRASC